MTIDWNDMDRLERIIESLEKENIRLWEANKSQQHLVELACKSNVELQKDIRELTTRLTNQEI